MVEFLHRAIESGKARFIGLSGKNARLIARILESIDVDTILVAHQFNPIYRNAESFLFPQTEEKGVGVMLGAVLMKGWLALPMLEWQKERPSWMDEPFARSYFQFVELSQTSGIPMAELTIRWVLEESRQHCLLFGFKSQEDICHNLAYAIKGPMPADIKTEIDNIGFVHPLIYQGRDAL